MYSIFNSILQETIFSPYGINTMANAWMEHVKAVKKQHPKKSLKEVLKVAAKSYKKNGTKKVAHKKTMKVKVHRKKTGGMKTLKKTRGKKSRGRKHN